MENKPGTVYFSADCIVIGLEEAEIALAGHWDLGGGLRKGGRFTKFLCSIWIKESRTLRPA